jgi:hypothetical protein
MWFDIDFIESHGVFFDSCLISLEMKPHFCNIKCVLRDFLLQKLSPRNLQMGLMLVCNHVYKIEDLNFKDKP